MQKYVVINIFDSHNSQFLVTHAQQEIICLFGVLRISCLLEGTTKIRRKNRRQNSKASTEEAEMEETTEEEKVYV